MTAGKIECISLPKKKARTSDERPGGESRGIFHFKQGGRAGPLCFFLSMYSPRAHPGPPSPMDSEILIKPLSLWPEYSTGGLLIFAKKRKSLGAVTLRDFLYPHTLSGASSTIHSTVRKMVTSWLSLVRTTLLWWRWRELNPRPKTNPYKLLRVQSVFSDSLTGTPPDRLSGLVSPDTIPPYEAAQAGRSPLIDA